MLPFIEGKAVLAAVLAGLRVAWFEDEDRVAEDVKMLVEAEVGDVERLPQDVREDRPIRFFVSYAHEDAALKERLLGRLVTFFATQPNEVLKQWSDAEILPGKKWREEIRKEMKACDCGLLLVSPALLASKFIVQEELAYLLRNSPRESFDSAGYAAGFSSIGTSL